MPRYRSWVGIGAASLLLGVSALPVKASRPSEDLVPDSTTGFVAVSDVDVLAEHWQQTQLGQLMADPVMEPFAKDLRRQLEDRWSGVRQRMGLTLDDLKGVPGGEVAVALILRSATDADTPDKACLAIVVDVTGHLPQAKALLEKVTKNLTERGAKQSEINLPESPTPLVQFDHLPQPEDDPPSGPGKAFYFLADNLLVAADDIEVIQGILARLSAPDVTEGALASLTAFQEVRRRCLQDSPDHSPQVRWFIRPLGYVAAIRAATPEKDRRKGKSVLEILRNQGFDAIQGVGGFVDFHVTEEFQIVHRTAVYAPRRDEYEKSMKMLAFPNGQHFEPQRWVPRDVATYTTLYVDILNAFDNFGPLFDEMFGGLEFLFALPATHQADLNKGALPDEFRQEFKKLDVELAPQPKISTREVGSAWGINNGDETFIVRERDNTLNVYGEMRLWDEVLQGLKDPDDPLIDPIDLRKELVSHLGTRVTMITSYQEPITTTSERLLFAIETTNEEAVAAAIQKTMQTDPAVKRREVEGEQYVIWEIVEEQQAGPPEIPIITIPSLAPEEDQPEPEAEEDEERDTRLLPHAAVTVAHGHLFVASHIDFLKKVLAPVEERETLKPSLDYRLVEEAVTRVGVTTKCALVFSRTDEEYRPTYELIRQGNMPQGETMLARVLNAVFTSGKKGEFRAQKIDGTQMPEYDIVRRYLGPAGMGVTSEPNGWFFKGFTLKKGSP